MFNKIQSSNNVQLQKETVLTITNPRTFHWKLKCIFQKFYCTCNSSQGPLDLLIAVWSLLVVNVWICSFLFRLIFQKNWVILVEGISEGEWRVNSAWMIHVFVSGVWIHFLNLLKYSEFKKEPLFEKSKIGVC